jgi:leader peptidase (prepilin peptidase) / N-methyltransferase
MSIALYAAIAVLILASPFAGRAAAAFVAFGLDGLEPREEAAAEGAGRPSVTGTPRFIAGMQVAFVAGAVWASLAVEWEAAPWAILLCWLLIVLSCFDILAFVLPDLLTYGLLAAGLAGALLQGQEEAALRIAGAIAGGGSLLLVSFLFRLATKREGLGLGDVKLFAAAGAWVGLEGLPQVLLAASVLGLIYALFSPAAPEGAFGHKKIPFGAGLCLALWVTRLYGPVFW